MLELAPERVGARLLLSLALQSMGRREEALAEANAEREEWARLCALAVAHAYQGNRAASDEALRRLTESYGDSAAYQIAAIHAARGERDEAFAWLERCRTQRDPGLTWAKLEPVFRPMRADSRWNDFLRKMGLADSA